MGSLAPGDVVGQLVLVLNGALGRVGIGAECIIHATEFEDIDVRELIQAREFDVACRNVCEVAVVPQPELVHQAGGEGVIFGKRYKICVDWLYRVKGRREPRRVDGTCPVQNEAAPERIFVRDAVINGSHRELVIGEGGRGYRDQSNWYGYTGRARPVDALVSRPNDRIGAIAASRGCRCRRSRAQILFQHAQVGLVDPRESSQSCVTRCGGSANRSCGANGANRIVLVVDEKEQLVFLDRAAEGATEAIVVVARMQWVALHEIQIIRSVQVSVYKVF